MSNASSLPADNLLSTPSTMHVPTAERFAGGRAMSPRSKLGMFLMWVFTGIFGGHRFYLGDIKGGIIIAVVTAVTLGLGSIVAFIDGLVLLFTREEDESGRAIGGWKGASNASLDDAHQNKFYKDAQGGKDLGLVEQKMDQESIMLLLVTTLGSLFGGAFIAPIGWYALARQEVTRTDLGLPQSPLTTITKVVCVASSMFGMLMIALMSLYYFVIFGTIFAVLLA